MARKKLDNIERNYDGPVARYTRKKSEEEKKLRDPDDWENDDKIYELKDTLRGLINAQAAQRRTIFRQTTDSKNSNKVLTGDCRKARDSDVRETKNSINHVIQQLARYGVSVKRDRAGKVSFGHLKEGGPNKMMYDVTELKKMKLETFQESAAGRITKEATDYLLKYFDVMIEEASGEDINTLVTDYVAACKESDEEKKSELKGKISAKADCKKAKEELAGLKEKLSDDEKKFVDELDEEICGTKEPEEGTGNSDNPVNESGEEDTGSADDSSSNSGEDVEKDINAKAKKSADKAGEDNKEAFDQLLSAASESVISDVGKEALLEYMTESVALGDMDADDAIALATLMSV